MTAQAFSGAMWIVGDRDFPEPAVTVGSVFDVAGASFLAYGIMAALVARERTGVGQQVDCSLLSAAIHIQAMNICSFLFRL
jgi:CoA:oxalate CoA-transferase